jgi:hypothetical protein
MDTLNCLEQSSIMNCASKMFLIPSKRDTKEDMPLWEILDFLLTVGEYNFERKQAQNEIKKNWYTL